MTPARTNRAGQLGHAWPLIAVLLIVIACSAMIAIQPHWINPHLGIQDEPKITKIIYPTLGNPAIMQKGSALTIEFDHRKQVWWRVFLRPMAFQVEAVTSNGPAKLTRELEVSDVRVGYSSRWPEYEKVLRQDRRIYLVTVQVPTDLPDDLYDLRVSSRFVVYTSEDTQPHALQVVDSYKDRFSFVQLTDVHVWGHEVEYPSCCYHERSNRPNGVDLDRKGAVYYQKAIDQINLIRPDFVIFSGDCIFGQKYFVADHGTPWGTTTEYEYEMMWFYNETLRLDVPVYMVMGNHDSYNEGNEASGEDWFVNWRKLYGPLYHSFDYGPHHFVACNSQDWSARERSLVDWFDIMLQPKKYKGSFKAGGDKAASGITAARLAEVDEASFRGQLAWIRDDLKANQGAQTRVLIMHHDPYKADGSGEMWGVASGKGTKSELKHMLSRVLKMGDGGGRLAIMKLMQDYRVALELSGHDHSDYVATRAQAQATLGSGFIDMFTWKGGGGEVVYANTTSTQFQTDGASQAYPGYRWIWIDGSRVENVNYKDPKWSFPWYEGCAVGGTTTLNKLSAPAIRSSTTHSQDSSSAAFTVENTLDVGLPGAYAEVKMAALPEGQIYVVDNGELAGMYEVPGEGGGIVCQVELAVPPRSAATATVRRAPLSVPTKTGR